MLRWAVPQGNDYEPEPAEEVVPVDQVVLEDTAGDEAPPLRQQVRMTTEQADELLVEEAVLLRRRQQGEVRMTTGRHQGQRIKDLPAE